MAGQVRKFDTEYYDVTFSIRWSKNGVWIGEVSIRRKDTGEEVPEGYYNISGDEELIREEISDKIKKISPFLSVPPPDWNSRVRNILARFTDTERKSTSFGIFLDNLFEKGNQDYLLMEKFGQFCHELTSDVIWLVREIEGLTEHERKELLTSEYEVYSNPMDAFNLDDLTARSEIFDYFIRTSLDEIRVHELHDKKFQDAVDAIDDSEE